MISSYLCVRTFSHIPSKLPAWHIDAICIELSLLTFIFLDTAKSMHGFSFAGLVFYLLRIPTIGGKELDLHVFYIEVSGRGGFEQV